ncbi:hypothetical protein RDWZM_010019 [Blomia tropicalis]|uniref:Beta-1,4-N-acetylgalactosaminyltransferase bre-4-like n=1 Tax=Blomia tropicalis TaxID=40697 RepID=A0A9Q0LXY9_BLOTA|nr:hypothetical protein RDWZM_010019 [Blomia tropicalis]
MSSFFRLFRRSNRHRRHHQNGRRVLSYRSSASSATKTNSNLIRNHRKFSQKPLSNQYKMIKCNEYDIDVSSSSSTSKSLLETNLIRQLLRRTRYPLLLFCFVFFFVIQFRANHYVVTSTSNNMMPMMINTLNRNGTSFNSTIINNHNNLNLNNHLNLTTKPITIKPIIDVAHNNNNCTNCTIIDSCPSKPNKLVGRLKVLTNPPSMIEMESKLNQISIGGRFRPDQCRPRDRVAIIVPYRDREQHLRTFLWNMHPMLMRQNIDYAIYIVEQYGNDRFNRAKLMNVGFLEAGKQYDYDCYIFHDVDLIPEDDRNLYTCPKQPRHMSVAVDKFRYRLPYKDLFGGVSALTREQFLTVNGFSNEFWGWGGEDDDMSNRVRHHHYKIERYPKEIARYTMLKHDQDAPSADRYYCWIKMKFVFLYLFYLYSRFKKLYNGWRRFQTDGINNTQYEVIDITFKKLYTLISVDVLAPPSIAKSSKNGYHKKHVFNAASASATAHKRRTRFYAYQHPSSLFSHRFH